MTIKTMLRVSAAAALLAGCAALPAWAQQKKPAPAAPAADEPARTTWADQLKFPKLNPIKMPAVDRETLPDGMKLILIEDHEFPVISMRAVIRGGKLAEPAAKPGLTDLFQSAHETGGVKSMSGDEVDDFLERIGASIDTGARDAYYVVSAKTLKEQFAKVLPLYAEYFTAPRFAQDKIDLAKTHLNSAIARRNDEAMGIVAREYMKKVYGAKSPYARQFEYDDIAALTREDLLAYFKTTVRPDETIMAVWGDFNTAEMKAQLEKTFASWKAEGPAPEYKLPAIPASEPSISFVEKSDQEQTTILMGHLGLRMDDPDFPAVNMLSDILGGGMSSRIFIQVRTLKGLAYGAGGQMVPAYDHLGAFYFYTATKPSTTAQALDAMLEEIKKIRQGPVTDEELAKAKAAYLNTYAFEFDSTDKIATRIATYELYGYPADFNIKLRDAVEKVTKDDVFRAAQKHLNPDALTIVAIGVSEKFDKPLTTFGKVNTIDITIPEPKAAKEAIPEATPQSLARGKDLLLAAAKAAGETALRGLKDVVTEGTNSIKTPMGDMDLKSKSTFALPDRLCVEMTTPVGAMVQVVSGDKAWMVMGGKNRDLPGSAADEMKKGLWTESGCALLLKTALEGKVQAQALGKQTFEGKDAEALLIKDAGGLKLFLSPDGQTVLGSSRMGQTEEGPAELTEIYGAFTAVSGLRIPFEVISKAKGEVQGSSKVASVKINGGFSADLFTKPAAPAAK